MDADRFTIIFWVLLSCIRAIILIMRDNALILLAADFPSGDAVCVSEARFVGL